MFDPNNAFANDVYSSNFNAEASHNIAAANAQNANTNSWVSLAAALLSDRTLKERIVVVGRSREGHEIVEFTYAAHPSIPTHLRGGRFRGVIAQDVETRRPDAVVRGTDGLLRVLYHRIDVKMERVPDIRVLKAA
jgi:hypothetical protein